MRGCSQTVVALSLMSALALAGTTVGTVGAGQENDGSKALTPGRVALLGNNIDEAALGQLRVALTAPDPIVRAVAARLVGVTAQGALAGTVAEAWAREQSPDAAAEQARALLFISKGESAAVIEGRLDSVAIARVYAEWMVRNRPNRLADTLSKLPAPLSGEFGELKYEKSARRGAMRTMPVLWPGFLRSLLDATRCRAGGQSRFGVVAVTYRDDGTVGTAEVSREPLPSGCTDALHAMLRLTLADAAYSPSQEILIFPFGPDAVECSGFVHAAGYRPAKVSGSVKPPRKTRDLQPVYPPHLLKGGVEGTVVVESLITTKGCVSEIKVMSSVEPSMDFAALGAVLGWRFTPTIVDGQAVPVTMTVTVNFRTGA